ncbi:hypothetical protein L1987_47761 [Smallanthus sonchifolius]|uniref:Uncharacterized protein n=1 Tax=Smallanthus sonchifolius TaxID=185202 RepID=A0ACB9FPY0_9ASTR|nr:hypothetical protein L1987_47761 [Smallanthus sonchifolius]
MPRKKEPPPSALPPRRSARGLSRSASSDADDSVELGVPTVGREETPEGLATSPPPPLLHPTEHDLGLFVSEGTGKISGVAGKPGLAEKPGLARNTAGLSDSDGSPVVQPSGGTNSYSMNESSGGRITVVESTPPVTPLFSPEFKAMIGREYPMRTVFSTRPALSGEATRGHGLWDGLAQCRSESVGESSSMSGVHAPLPDVHELVHAPEGGVNMLLLCIVRMLRCFLSSPLADASSSPSFFSDRPPLPDIYGLFYACRLRGRSITVGGEDKGKVLVVQGEVADRFCWVLTLGDFDLDAPL